MTPLGRTSGKSPPDMGITRPFSRGPSIFPEAAYTAARVAPMEVGLIHCSPASSMEMVKACSSVGEKGCTGSSGGAEADAESAPVTATHKDRGRKILDQHEISTPHIAAIGLEEKTLGIVRDLFYGAVVVDPPVATIRGVPYRVFALGLHVVGIVGRQVPPLRP